MNSKYSAIFIHSPTLSLCVQATAKMLSQPLRNGMVFSLPFCARRNEDTRPQNTQVTSPRRIVPYNRLRVFPLCHRFTLDSAVFSGPCRRRTIQEDTRLAGSIEFLVYHWLMVSYGQANPTEWT